MAQILEFVSNHMLLVAAFSAVLTALLWTLAKDVGGNSISPQQAVMLLNRESAVPIDIRNAAGYRAGHIINSLNIDLAEFTSALPKLEKHKTQPVLICCEAGTSSQRAFKQLTRAGFSKVYQLRGGIAAWRGENLPLETSK